jgi:hypothetical protein
MMTIVQSTAQYTMKKDFYQLALVEWKKSHPYQRRESDFGPKEREEILAIAKRLETQLQ